MKIRFNLVFFRGAVVLMLKYTFVLNCSDHISLPVLQFQSGVFHSLILWDVAHMQNSTIETLLIHVSLGCSETTTKLIY